LPQLRNKTADMEFYWWDLFTQLCITFQEEIIYFHQHLCWVHHYFDWTLQQTR